MKIALYIALSLLGVWLAWQFIIPMFTKKSTPPKTPANTSTSSGSGLSDWFLDPFDLDEPDNTTTTPASTPATQAVGTSALPGSNSSNASSLWDSLFSFDSTQPATGPVLNPSTTNTNGWS